MDISACCKSVKCLHICDRNGGDVPIIHEQLKTWKLNRYVCRYVPHVGAYFCQTFSKTLIQIFSLKSYVGVWIYVCMYICM
jgi:hypothetical protein